MALNLSTLTSPATSDDVLAEVLTTADFLEPVPVLRNLARGTNAGGDAKQDVALNQPKALPLIENPAGDLGGYLYIPDVTGNYAEGPSVTIGANETWEGELDMVITQWGSHIMPMGGGDWSLGFGAIFYSDGGVRVFSGGSGANRVQSGVTLGAPFNIKYGYDGANLYVDIDDVRVYTSALTFGQITETLQLAQDSRLTYQGNYAIQKAKLTVNNAVVFDCDFNGSTSIRHGDTKFQAAVGGPVTLTRAGNDPLTVVKKSVLRFDGVNSSLQGLFDQTITDGYMFAAFSVLGDGGEGHGRVFSVNSTGQADNGSQGYVFSLRNGVTNKLSYHHNLSYLASHVGLFDDALRDILHESKAADGNQSSKVNNADIQTTSVDISALSAEEFCIARGPNNSANSSIDLEYLALFPADSVPDEATASRIRNYINNRNNVFYRWDTDGYYFYNPQDLSSGAVTTWNGRIVGSDNGDADKNATQSTSADQPTSDGYKVTFADNTDHFDIPSTTQAGWQVVGTSLGTFAYKVNADAVTELNLLGNLGNATYRRTGDLYGIILLPESATGREINEAKKLLTDRGASVSATASVQNAWRGRSDIVQFDGGDMANATDVYQSWRDCASLTSFSTELPSATNVTRSWSGCSSLSDFRTTDIKNCSNFSKAWQNCSSLTQFPEDAKLGTEASNVNFSEAWRSSGLTSFSTPLPTATNVASTWNRCSSLTSFNAELPLANYAGFTFYNCSSLTSFNSELPLVRYFGSTWLDCSLLTDFSADVLSNWNPTSINSGVFDRTWDGCTSLTSQSVENILVSIDASGKYATSTGLSGGTALADAGIDIDYNGDPLSAATTAAITSLKSKGWSIFINSVEQ